MRVNEFDRKDGTKGKEYKLEAGDKFVSQYAKVKETNLGLYPKFQLGVKVEGKEEVIYITLTKAQAEKLSETEDLTNKTVECYTYENKYGEQVGVKVK